MPLASASLFGNPEQASIWRRARFNFPPTDFSSYPAANYINPKERGPVLYIINPIILAIMLASVTLRLYTRICVRKYFGLDDMFIIFALVGAVAVTTCIILGSDMYFWNRHAYDIPFSAIKPSGKVLFATRILWYFTSTCVRASIMCLFYRLIDHLGLARYRWILHANSAFILGLFLAQEMTSIVSCWPVQAFWTYPLILEAKCMNIGAATMAVGILNTISEFIVAALPLPVIFSVMISKKQRQAVTGLLCGGFLVVIVGSVRLYYLWQMVTTGDPTWWSQPHWICSEIEMDVAIIIACAPAMMAVISRVLTEGFSSVNKANPSHLVTKGNLQSKKLRFLFGQIKTQSSQTELSINTGQSSPISFQSRMQRAIDIEAVSNDGYGYTITINTGYGTKVRRRWDIRNRRWLYFPEEAASDLDESASVQNSDSKAPLSRISDARKVSSTSAQPKTTENSQQEVQTETRFDRRDSYQSGQATRQFEFKHSFRNKMPEIQEDIEIELERPKIAASHPANEIYDDIRMGVLPSPSTLMFEGTAHPPAAPRRSSLKITNSSPPTTPARYPSSTSSASQPLNSSHAWATSPRMLNRLDDPSSTEKSSDADSTEAYTNTATDTSFTFANMAGRWQKSSLHSSMHGENGSRKSAEEMSVRSVRKDQDGDSSDEEFSLPLQRPSSRTSSARRQPQERLTPSPLVLTRWINEDDE